MAEMEREMILTMTMNYQSVRQTEAKKFFS